MVGCGIRRPELALVIHAKATPPPPPPPSVPPSPVCRGFTWIIPLPPALGGNSIDGPPSHTLTTFFTLHFTGRQHFYQKGWRGEKNAHDVRKTIMFCGACCRADFTSRDYVMFLKRATSVRAPSLQSHTRPSCRSGGDSIYIPPIHLCVTRYLLPVPCVPVSRAFSWISASAPVSGLKHFEMHFLHWTGFLLRRSEQFPINNVLYNACGLIRM